MNAKTSAKTSGKLAIFPSFRQTADDRGCRVSGCGPFELRKYRQRELWRTPLDVMIQNACSCPAVAVGGLTVVVGAVA